MHHDTTETSFERRLENAATVCVDDLLQTRAPLGPPAAFLAAHQRLSMLAEIGDPTSLLVVAVDPEARVVAGLLVRDRGTLIIGRHTRCGLRLPARSVAMRQAALLFRRERGRPIIHLWDLDTGAPFATEDGHAPGAIPADGPVYLQIGPYALWLMPVALAASLPASAALAWRALPPCKVVDRSVEPRLLPGDGVDPEIGWGTLHFAIGTHLCSWRVSAERLARGILVGRDAGCAFPVESERISRVHLLLAWIDGDLWAIDTASTFGIRRGKVKIEAEVLRDADAFSLARELIISWERTEHPEA